jgi:hypothetical protein
VLAVLKIQRSIDAGNVRLSLSGRIEKQHLAELERVIDEDACRHALILDLEQVRLVDRDAVGFLARREAAGIRLENCPAYVREWITIEGTPPGSPPRTTRQ